MRRTIGIMGTVAVLAGVALASRDTAAKPARKGAKGEPEAAPLSAASLAQLKSDDPAAIRAGLDDARLSGTKAVRAVPAIEELLATGLPYPLAEAAIDTLADIQPSDVTPLLPYLHHRDPKVRRAAARALGKATLAAGVTTADAALQGALGDADPQVRAFAAIGLGSLKAKGSVPLLFVALDHRVFEAAASIGQLCVAADCDALMGRLGKVPFDVLTTGVDQVLFRPASEVSDDAKVAIVAKVRDVGTGDANKFLRTVQGRWPKNGSAKVKGAIDAAVIATMSSPGAGR